ncbi:hypothetical protein CALVIDRAFT_540329 [Calocera viscosa TUFC12733]|uniref:Uncharacterized protein n=1 Tax=Calocera viscosa (strain TUFC12733) TaxID=1330018 RepID=A0A167IY58_CALVF|nr:hypothetical protein CALVIDRAFT_540329 [Calocera viscosa TUFC12733]
MIPSAFRLPVRPAPQRRPQKPGLTHSSQAILRVPVLRQIARRRQHGHLIQPQLAHLLTELGKQPGMRERSLRPTVHAPEHPRKTP